MRMRRFGAFCIGAIVIVVMLAPHTVGALRGDGGVGREGEDVERGALPGAFPAETAEQLRSTLRALAVEFRPKAAMAASDVEQTAKDRYREELDAAITRLLTESPAQIAQAAIQIELVAPDVWKMLVRQQYARALGDFVRPWFIVTVIAAYWYFFGVKWLKWLIAYGDRGGNEAAMAAMFGIIVAVLIPGIAAIWYAFVGIRELSTAITVVSNPGYYAIRDLLALLLGAA